MTCRIREKHHGYRGAPAAPSPPPASFSFSTSPTLITTTVGAPLLATLPTAAPPSSGLVPFALLRLRLLLWRERGFCLLNGIAEGTYRTKHAEALGSTILRYTYIHTNTGTSIAQAVASSVL